MSDDTGPKYKSEYATSNRAICRLCKDKIDKGQLRLAAMVFSPMVKGMMARWYHSECFFEHYKPKSIDMISGASELRYADLQAVEELLKTTRQKYEKEKQKEEMKRSKQPKEDTKMDNFEVEYSKSNRSKCRCCDEKISKDTLRMMYYDYESSQARMYGAVCEYYHVDCFARSRVSIDFYATPDKVKGFDELEQKDQKQLILMLPQIVKEKAEPIDVKPVTPAVDDGLKSSKCVLAMEKFKLQNELVYKYRDRLDKNLSKKQLAQLLERNRYVAPSGKKELLEILSDFMAFGTIPPCASCKNGIFIYSAEKGYRCSGQIDEEQKCSSVNKSPKRNDLKIPSSLREEFSFLSKYKGPSNEERICNPKQSTAVVESPTKSGKRKLGTIEMASALDDVVVCLVGRLRATRYDISKVIQDMGGRIVSSVDEGATVVVSTKAEVEAMTEKIADAKRLGVPVVSEDFVGAVRFDGVMEDIVQSCRISDWGISKG